MAVLRNDPYGNFNFLVEIDGMAIAGFSEVSGLAVEITYAEYRDGNERSNEPRRIPTSHRYQDLVLRRGVTGATELFGWLKAVRDGQPDPRNLVVTLLDEARSPVLRWFVRRAQPRKWSGPALSGVGTLVAIEELVLVYEGLEIE